MTTIVMGDQAEGNKWYSVAHQLKQELKRVHGRTNKFMQVWKHITPDVKIHVMLRNGEPLAFIYTESSSDYMESGVMQYNLFGCGQPALTAVPWNIDIAAQTNAVAGKPAIGKLVDQAPVPSGGGIIRQTLDGDNNVVSTTAVYSGLTSSLAFGDFDENLVSEIDTTDCSGNPIHVTGEKIMTSKNLEAKKYAMTKAPASIFSGVMRRYVQAMYGSTRFDMNVSKDKVYPHINIAVMVPQSAIEAGASEEVTISVAYPNLMFIRRTPEYQYFFCFASGKSIVVTNMWFDSAGEKIRLKLQNEHATMSVETIKILESYALAYAKIGYGVIATVPITGEDLIGNPIGFTWSSNEDGSEHTIVLHEEDDGIRMYRAREYRLIVDFQSSDGGETYSMQAACSLVGSPALWNPREYIVWAADYTFGGNFWLSGSWSLGLASSIDTYSEVPLYSYFFQKENSLWSSKKVVKLHNAVSYYGTTDIYGEIGTGICDSYEYTNFSVDGTTGYTTWTKKYPGREGMLGIEALTGYMSRNREEHNAGTWSSAGSFYDSTTQCPNVYWNRYDPYEDVHVSALNCSSNYVLLLDGGEGNINYTNAFYGRLVVDEPVYSSWSRPDITDTARCWAYVPWNASNSLVIGVSHNTAHSAEVENLNSPCNGVGTGVYMAEYGPIDGNPNNPNEFKRLSSIRTTSRAYSNVYIDGNPPAFVWNSSVNVAAHTDYDNTIQYLIDDETKNVIIDEGQWLYDVVVPDTLFAQGQPRALSIAGLKDNYRLGWFGTKWNDITKDFIADGIGCVGWG
jgi:hypothetical protein